METKPRPAGVRGLIGLSAASLTLLASLPSPTPTKRPKSRSTASTTKPDDIVAMKKIMSPRQLRKYLKSRRYLYKEYGPNLDKPADPTP